MPGPSALEALRRLTAPLLVAALAVTVAGCGSSTPADSVTTPLEDPPVTIVSDEGQQIEIDGAGPVLGPLVEWALGRFAEARLPEPQVPRIQFRPDDPACFGVTGLFRENDEGRSIVICLDESRICEFPDAPDGYRAPARSCILHELAHAWMRDNLDDGTREEFVADSPVDSWYEKGGAWIDQGVEHAAEIIMWGLMDEPLALNRIDDPPCPDLEARFRLLTGVDPLISCEHRP